jgi:hypothetical protein
MAPDGVILLAPWSDAFTREEPWALTAATLRGFQQSFGLSCEDKNLRCLLIIKLQISGHITRSLIDPLTSYWTPECIFYQQIWQLKNTTVVIMEGVIKHISKSHIDWLTCYTFSFPYYIA